MVIEHLSALHDAVGFMDGASPDGDIVKPILFLGATGLAYLFAGEQGQGNDQAGHMAHARDALAGMLHHSLHHRDL